MKPFDPHNIPTHLKPGLVAYLAQFISPNKLARIDEILTQRTRYLTVVLENIYQAHNASAVIRSCECFGVQDIHVIERDNAFKPTKPIALGSAKWMTLNRYPHTQSDNTRRCVETLRQRGYRIAAMTLRENSIPIDDLPLDQKTALCFGEEQPGLSEEAHDLADVFVNIPMLGFTQSFNISVTVALSLYALSTRLRTSPGIPWQLSPEEQLDLRLDWYTKIPNQGAKIAEQYLKAQAQ